MYFAPVPACSSLNCRGQVMYNAVTVTVSLLLMRLVPAAVYSCLISQGQLWGGYD